MSEQRKVGRPSVYSDEVATEICTRLAGGESLRAICRDDHMPAISSVTLWVVDGRHPEFSARYMQAREAQGYYFADAMLELATDVGTEVLDAQRAKVMMDAYKWTAERCASKAYGQRKSIDHTSSDSSMTPAPTRIELVAPDDDSKG